MLNGQRSMTYALIPGNLDQELGLKSALLISFAELHGTIIMPYQELRSPYVIIFSTLMNSHCTMPVVFYMFDQATYIFIYVFIQKLIKYSSYIN